ncbi:MAG TPA: DotD/TraH family lipoprotein [Alphaproteobacteria bacterium]
MNTLKDKTVKLIAMAAMLLAVLPTLSACGFFGAARGQPKPQLVAEADPSTLQLADAADRATRALESLAAVEQTRTPSAAAAAMIPAAPPELQKAVTFVWSGPVEPVARDLAAKSGYTFRTIGDTPAAPIVVNLNVYNEPMIEVLRDIGLQMGSRADLRLDANSRAVEIIYAPTVNQATSNSSMTTSSGLPQGSLGTLPGGRS